LKPNYEIYNASAGSGKTFALASRYLARCLGSNEDDFYRRILALTFTNKASEEMKTRILSSLKEFSKTDSIQTPTEIFKSVKEELNISFKEIQIRAKKRLQNLLHNYSFFQVSTLDSFSHNLIRSFAQELKIGSDFELILDPETILNESIDRLLESVGENKTITEALVGFANIKVAEGKSWDISFDLKELSQLITNENHYHKIKELETKTVKDFLLEKKEILNSQKKLEAEIMKEVSLCQERINATGRELGFSRNSFPGFLRKLKNKDFQNNNLASIKKLFQKDAIITKKGASSNQEILSELMPKLLDSFNKIEKKLYKWQIQKSFSNSIVPLSLLTEIKRISKEIQKEKNEILISDFNQIINEEIKGQPAPYIYEKTGNRFKHYLIDEFQDTSMLQWSNLTPLISHALESGESETDQGSLLLVGDPKQSLYRWRGADPDKFISLLNEENPFTIPKSIKNLPKNYRSCNEMVSFNNKFFEYVSKQFEFQENAQIYSSGAKQELNKKKGGYVSVEFIKNSGKNKSFSEQHFLIKTLKIISENIYRGFMYLDQCVLVRNKKQQALVVEFLINQKIPVVSSESLLLKNSSAVNVLIELVRLRIDPKNLKSRKVIIKYFIKDKAPKDVFSFFKKSLSLSIEEFFKYFLQASYEEFVQAPIYNAISKVNRSLQLDQREDAHVHFFMEELFGFFLPGNRREEDFLLFWETNMEKLAVVTNEEINAVQVLTIHKAKGLEFPIVIYPFADSKPHISNSQKVWLPCKVNKQNSDLLVPFSKAVENSGEEGGKAYKRIKKEEELDNINVLYVALTRAIKEMYIISSFPEKTLNNSHNEILKQFIIDCGKWEDVKEQSLYGFYHENLTEELVKRLQSKANELSEWDLELKFNLEFKPPLYIPINVQIYKYTCGERSWREKVKRKINTALKKDGEASSKLKLPKKIKTPNFYKPFENNETLFGTSFHELMSKIEYSFQLEKEVKGFVKNNNINRKEQQEIIELAKKVVAHKNLEEYFSKKYDVICEKEIINEKKEIIVPDRIVISKKQKHTIIDYKTGEKRPSDVAQIKKYEDALKNMGLKTGRPILVYVRPLIEVVEV